MGWRYDVRRSQPFCASPSVTNSFFRITAQLIGPHTKDATDGPSLQDMDLVVGPNRNQFASFTWPDLAAIAPWLEPTKKIDGPGLGN